jgi:hypothetical protein
LTSYASAFCIASDESDVTEADHLSSQRGNISRFYFSALGSPTIGERRYVLRSSKERKGRLYPLVILMRVAISDEFPVQLRNCGVASLPSCDELGQLGINVS